MINKQNMCIMCLERFSIQGNLCRECKKLYHNYTESEWFLEFSLMQEKQEYINSKESHSIDLISPDRYRIITKPERRNSNDIISVVLTARKENPSMSVRDLAKLVSKITKKNISKSTIHRIVSRTKSNYR